MGSMPVDRRVVQKEINMKPTIVGDHLETTPGGFGWGRGLAERANEAAGLHLFLRGRMLNGGLGKKNSPSTFEIP